ncbi:unnamed protein product [Leptidea sinapis]|uniref:Uncharacterized protein n=1 Tax=Leptidea sinapis TaxID=189913 RepID=A0A5E4Q5G0_9NEOP|nr:unnamed protein product [Leptidea sinapis]
MIPPINRGKSKKSTNDLEPATPPGASSPRPRGAPPPVARAAPSSASAPHIASPRLIVPPPASRLAP